MAQPPSDHHILYQLQYRKCGKSSCHRCRHSQGHGPYWYAYWRDGSRLRSMYIGKARPASLDASLGSSTPESKLEAMPDLAREESKTGEGRSGNPDGWYNTELLIQRDIGRPEVGDFHHAASSDVQKIFSAVSAMVASSEHES
jgi:hypothetical protein